MQKIIILLYIIIFLSILDKKMINYFNFHIKNDLNNKVFYYIYSDNYYNKSINSIIKLKKVVYSALLGKYDRIQPFNLQKGFDFILFTDLANINNNEANWTILPLPKELNNLNLSKFKKQRFIKLHPHLFFQNYSLSIYIDTSFQIKGDLNEFLLRILKPEYNTTFFANYIILSILIEIKFLLSYLQLLN